MEHGLTDEARLKDAAAANAAVDVCVCTFRRGSLLQTLESLAGQQGAPPFRVIVADNDETPSAESLVNEARAVLKLDVTYVHAPARNISIARNACLDTATAPLVAFMDDDEIAPNDWLATMVSGLEGRDAVFGPVKALYAPDAPGWAIDGDFHSFGPAIRANGEIDTGYSSNVLFRRAAVGNLRFKPELGRSGGEDTFFFAALHAAGGKLGYCPDAALHEPTASNRANLNWLVRRNFRSGQTHARVQREQGKSAFAIAGPAFAKASYCVAAALLTVWSPVRVRKNIIRGALHVGVIARALGAAEPTLYGS